MQTSAPRFNGKLTKWNAERGFGFVVADHGDQEGEDFGGEFHAGARRVPRRDAQAAAIRIA